MTLDEAIKHAEKEAEEQKELYKSCPAGEAGIFYCDSTKDCNKWRNGKNKGCQKCAEEQRQLAEWLKDYKRLKEKEKPKVVEKSNSPRYGMGYDYYDWICPTCGEFLAYEPSPNLNIHRCNACGQALKWRAKNDR